MKTTLKTMMTAAACALSASTASASIDIQFAHAYAGMNHDITGIPAITTGTTEFLPTGAILPFGLHGEVNYAHGSQLSRPHIIADSDANMLLGPFGVAGTLDYNFSYSYSGANSSDHVGSVARDMFVFEVTGSTYYTMIADFSGDLGPGSMARLTNEDTGAFISGTSVGDDQHVVGLLTAGRYRFTAQFTSSRTGSAGTLDRHADVEWLFTFVPAPSSAVALAFGGVVAARRRR